MSPDAVADKFTDDGVAIADGLFFHIGADIAQSVSGLHELHSASQNSAR